MTEAKYQFKSDADERWSWPPKTIFVPNDGKDSYSHCLQGWGGTFLKHSKCLSGDGHILKVWNKERQEYVSLRANGGADNEYYEVHENGITHRIYHESEIKQKVRRLKLSHLF